ncbi:MAG TPA: CHAT domain-containing protein, partial [Thermoanaerobaculia bacterium]|nr:CHAT domain-containing protein [Thermoanaerobaculia bacterium]
MSKNTYLDFDLAIERTTDGYCARVLQSPAGQAATTFKQPLSDLEIDNFFLRLGRSRGSARRVESSEMIAAKGVGTALFGAVFGGEVRGCWRASDEEATRSGAGLRLRLHLGDVPELAGLPWEFLYNPTLNRFLALSTETPIVRYLDLPERVRPLTVKPPLRILAIVASPTDLPQLDVEREYENLKRALGALTEVGRVALERLSEPTLAGLQRRLRQGEYNVFHFIGHGGFDRQGEDGFLCFESEDRRARQVGSQFLGTLLHDHRSFRLAVLNACEGCRGAACDPFSGTAQGLVQQGVPAVIAMQAEISDQAAITFSEELYSAVAAGYPVDAALAEARKAIFSQVNELEWGTPVLYMRASDGRIFDVQEISEEERRQVPQVPKVEAQPVHPKPPPQPPPPTAAPPPVSPV